MRLKPWNAALFFSLFCSLLVHISCSPVANRNSKMTHFIEQLQVESIQSRQSIAPETPFSKEVRAHLTLKKSEIFNHEFFYGADLQYSSVYDAGYDLYNQSLAMGHIPAFFRKHGNELQLIADQRRLYPSDVNHPEQLISRFQIISENNHTITVSEGNASHFIVALLDSKSNQAKDHWARSLEYVSDGNILLQETSIVLPNGDILEVMESIIPQESLSVSSRFEKFQMDPQDPIGASEGPAYRYRFLNGESIFNGEEKLAFSQHYDIYDSVTGKPTTIDWYVTPNIKDEHLTVVQEAVEGWNRYFRKFTGIERDVLSFKGRMPDGMKLGDPRFNIINWDSRLVAGAAYETQASDPFTGKQSHSLIYMPVAWFQIGMDYWKNGKYSDSITSKNKTSIDQFQKFNQKKMVKASCVRDLTSIAEALHSGRMSKNEAEKFSVQLMKQTLFHEVGHALGFAHNFKGSLSFDRKNPKSIFSTSIMDYNDYEVERAAFYDQSSVKGDGPQLEYDRQVLSALYNQMKDVTASDPEVPVCNDAEADTEESGSVDPLCMRYDIENDPTLSISTALNRVTKETMEGDVTLSQALEQVSADLLSPDLLSEVKTQEDAKKVYQNYLRGLRGTMGFYFLTGKASISKAVRNNVKSLYVFKDEVLPVDVSELAMRERAYLGLQTVMSMKVLPENVRKKIADFSKRMPEILLKSPFGSSLSIEAATTLKNKFSEMTMAIPQAFETDEIKGLPRLREAVLNTIARSETLPFYLGALNGVTCDFESAMMNILYEMMVDPSHFAQERLAAAHSFVTYRGRPGANLLLGRAISAIKLELASARTNDSRELAMALKLALFSQKQ
jgi:hypothetical protein